MEKKLGPITISIRQLVSTLKESTGNGQRFCFILGSGASVTSGIPMGRVLEKRWMDEIMKNPSDYERTANDLKDREIMQFDFNTLKEAWEKANEDGGSPIPSEYYFDIYNLRYYIEKRNGYQLLESLMENSEPSIGYRALAQLLAEDTGFDIVITTNFDSLTEDALFIYTDKRPIVVAHESLADYIELSKKQRPVIAKVHRGLFYAPKNDRESTSKLSDEWTKVLSRVFATYTPIVIGYAGGDGSLMSYLENPNTEIGGTMYWCLMKGDEPSDRITDLVAAKGGRFVEISGFDNTMLSIADKLCGAALDPDATSKMLNERTGARCSEYSRQWAEWEKASNSPDMVDDPAVDVAKKARDEEEKREKEGKLSAWDYFIRGYRLADAGSFKEAIEAYTDAIEKKPDYVEAYNNRGILYAKLGETEKAMTEKAMKDYSKAIEIKPDLAEPYCNRGLLYEKLDKHKEAMEDYSKAIGIKPDYATAYYNRGVLYAKLGETEKAMTEKAMKDYSKAIEIKPDFAEPYCNRGAMYQKLDEPEKAMRDYSRAIELKPDYAEAYYNRGILNSILGGTLGVYKSSIEDFSKAIELKHDFAEAYCQRGEAYFKHHKVDKAIENFSKAIELKTDYALAYRNRAIAFRALGRNAEAEADDKKAKEIENKGK